MGAIRDRRAPIARSSVESAWPQHRRLECRLALYGRPELFLGRRREPPFPNLLLGRTRLRTRDARALWTCLHSRDHRSGPRPWRDALWVGGLECLADRKRPCRGAGAKWYDHRRRPWPWPHGIQEEGLYRPGSRLAARP